MIGAEISGSPPGGVLFVRRGRASQIFRRMARNWPGRFLVNLNKKARKSFSWPFYLSYSRQRPTFPQSHPCSIIGAGGLNYRVRDGNGCDPSAVVTGKLPRTPPSLRAQK